MPRWQHPQDYAYTDSLESSGWAWEFLRRNPDYRHDFDECVSRDKAWVNAGGGRDNAHAIFDPPKKRGESTSVWRARVVIRGGVGTPRPIRPSVYYAKKWGLVVMTNPSGDSAPTFTSSGHPRLLRHCDVDELFNYPEPYDDEDPGPDWASQDGPVRAFTLDLRKPLDPQIAALRPLFALEKDRAADSIETERVRFEPDRWTSLLRLLDAKHLDVSASDICEFVYSEYATNHDYSEVGKEINRRFNQAKQLYSLRRIRSILESNANSEI